MTRSKALTGRIISFFLNERIFSGHHFLWVRVRYVDDVSRSWLGRKCADGGSLAGRTFCTPIL